MIPTIQECSRREYSSEQILLEVMLLYRGKADYEEDAGREIVKRLLFSKASRLFKIDQQLNERKKVEFLIDLYEKADQSYLQNNIALVLADLLDLRFGRDPKMNKIEPYLAAHVKDPPVRFIKDAMYFRWPSLLATSLVSAWIDDPIESEILLSRIETLEKMRANKDSLGKQEILDSYHVIVKTSEMQFWWMKWYAYSLLERIKENEDLIVYVSRQESLSFQNIIEQMKSAAERAIGLSISESEIEASDDTKASIGLLIINMSMLLERLPQDCDGINITYQNQDDTWKHDIKLQQITPTGKIVLTEIADLGGELLLSIRTDGKTTPWMYIAELNKRVIDLPNDAALSMGKSNSIQTVLFCKGLNQSVGSKTIGLYFNETSRLPLYRFDLNGIRKESFNLTIEVLPGTYFIRNIEINDDKTLPLGELTIADEPEKAYEVIITSQTSK